MAHSQSQQQRPSKNEIIIAACKAAGTIMERHGLDAFDVANGFIAFGSTLSLHLVGVTDTAAVLQSKADALGDFNN